MTDLHTPRHWRYRLLGVLDLPETTENLRFLQAWFTAEGGTAEYNPLNTTFPIEWFSNNYNSSGVKNYTRPTIGVCATAITLAQDTFLPIVQALSGGDLTAEQIVEKCRTQIKSWGTNPDVILNVLKTI
jgi:protein involved in polysaccharide export with SLBB domain